MKIKKKLQEVMKNNLHTIEPQLLNMNKLKTSDMRLPSYDEAEHLIKSPTSVPQLNMTRKETVDVDPPPYEAAVANKYADFNLTLQQDVSRVLERTERIEQTMDVVVKGHDQLRDHFQRESIENRHRQEEHQRNVTRSFEALNTKLDTVIHRLPGPRDDVHDESDENEMLLQSFVPTKLKDNVLLENNTGDGSCLYNCKKCKISHRCQCCCHRRNLNRNNTKKNGMKQAYHNPNPECSGDSFDAQPVDACGGNPGGSSDNPSDSTDDDMNREQKWSDQKRHRGKPTRDREDKPKSKNNVDERNYMIQRLKTYRKRRQRREKSESAGACGGNPGGSSNDPSDDSDDSKNHRGKKGQGRQEQKKGKPMWTIDTASWNICISRGKPDMIVDLLSHKKLPDNDLLNDARKVFESEFIALICDEICKYIVQKSKHIIYVYPATMRDETTTERDACNITFVVVLSRDTDLGNEFNFHKKNTTDPPSLENVEIRNWEKEERCELQNVNYSEAMLIKCIQTHSKSLRKDHTNVCRISNSRCRFDKGERCVKQSPCITLYVYAIGLIPFGENVLPKELNNEDGPVPVDVREGFVEVYTGNQGPCDTLASLKMGCSIGVEPRINEKIVNGTLGGFFEIGGTDFCISSAHVFLSANEMERLRTMETPILERNECAKPVFQPHDNYLIPFGKGRTAIYTEGGNGQTGVDVISILIENRNPNTGGFPKMEGDDETEKEYCHGKVYNREEIDNALKKDFNRCIYKYGCSTGWTTSRFRTDGATFRALHPVQDGNTDLKICLHNQFEIYNDTDNEFAGKSDSGALVFMVDDNELVAIGMVVAGMADEVCFVTPLDEILKALKLDPKNGLKTFTGGNITIETDGLSYPQDDRTVNVNMAELQLNMSNVTTDVENIKGNMVDMKSDINEIKNEMKSEMNDMKSDMNDMKSDMIGGFDEIRSMLQNIHLSNQHNS